MHLDKDFLYYLRASYYLLHSLEDMKCNCEKGAHVWYKLFNSHSLKISCFSPR